MTGSKEKYRSCFGILDAVFPKDEDGLRHTPKDCFACICKTECLRSAMRGSNGLGAQEEFVDRAYSSGMIGFLERWSKKKALRRRIRKK
jgi:hypothetical protein